MRPSPGKRKGERIAWRLVCDSRRLGDSAEGARARPRLSFLGEQAPACAERPRNSEGCPLEAPLALSRSAFCESFPVVLLFFLGCFLSPLFLLCYQVKHRISTLFISALFLAEMVQPTLGRSLLPLTSHPHVDRDGPLTSQQEVCGQTRACCSFGLLRSLCVPLCFVGRCII